MFEVKILADSICNGIRLTTAQLTFPRCILAEFNTHRMLSRNAASSRAIPTNRLNEKEGITDVRKSLWYLLKELGFSKERIKEITNEAAHIKL